MIVEPQQNKGAKRHSRSNISGFGERFGLVSLFRGSAANRDGRRVLCQQMLCSIIVNTRGQTNAIIWRGKRWVAGGV